MEPVNRYRIQVAAIQGDKTLIFHVTKYTILEGDFVEFYDEVKGRTHRIHASRCEIEVLQGVNSG